MSPLVVVCRLCLNLTEIASPVSSLTIFLKAVLPDMDLTLTKDPVVCKQCADSVTSSFNFKYKCMQQEMKVRKHYNETKNPVNLYDLVEKSCYTVTNDTEDDLVVKGTINVKFKLPCENPDNIKQEYYENQVTNGMEETKESVMDNGDMSNVVEIVESDIVDMSDDETDYPNAIFLKELPCKLPNNNDKFDAVSNRKDTEDIVRKTKKSRRKTSTWKKGLSKNSQEHEIHKCGQCTYVTTYKDRLTRHLKGHDTVYNCEKCDYKTPRKYDLNRHIHLHKDPKKQALYRHRLGPRKAAKIYKCDKCSFQSIHRISLRGHLLLHKNPEDIDMHKCEQCQYQTFRKSDLKKHLLIHKKREETNLHRCEKCDYHTANKHYFRRHLQRHESAQL